MLLLPGQPGHILLHVSRVPGCLFPGLALRRILGRLLLRARLALRLLLPGKLLHLLPGFFCPLDGCAQLLLLELADDVLESVFDIFDFFALLLVAFSLFQLAAFHRNFGLFFRDRFREFFPHFLPFARLLEVSQHLLKAFLFLGQLVGCCGKFLCHLLVLPHLPLEGLRILFDHLCQVLGDFLLFLLPFFQRLFVVLPGYFLGLFFELLLAL